MTNRILCISIVVLLMSGSAYSAVQYQRLGSTKANSQKGYDFYTTANVKTGFSKANRYDGFDYYDGRGNKIGSLKKPNKSKEEYVFYDANGIKKGILTKMPSGVYYYKDIRSGKLTDSVPQVSGKIGSLSPDIFQDTKGRNGGSSLITANNTDDLFPRRVD